MDSITPCASLQLSASTPKEAIQALVLEAAETTIRWKEMYDAFKRQCEDKWSGIDWVDTMRQDIRYRTASVKEGFSCGGPLPKRRCTPQEFYATWAWDAMNVEFGGRQYTEEAFLSKVVALYLTGEHGYSLWHLMGAGEDAPELELSLGDLKKYSPFLEHPEFLDRLWNRPLTLNYESLSTLSALLDALKILEIPQQFDSDTEKGAYFFLLALTLDTLAHHEHTVIGIRNLLSRRKSSCEPYRLVSIPPSRVELDAQLNAYIIRYACYLFLCIFMIGYLDHKGYHPF